VNIPQYDGMDADLRDTLLPGKYAFGIDGVDMDFKSTDKGTEGVQIRTHVIAGPPQDDVGTSAIGETKTFTFWYPKPTMNDGGKFCAKQLNGLLDAVGLHDVRKSGTPITPDMLLNQSFVAKSKIGVNDKTGRESDELYAFEPYVPGGANV
jgi:hypothetical protein